MFVPTQTPDGDVFEVADLEGPLLEGIGGESSTELLTLEPFIPIQIFDPQL